MRLYHKRPCKECPWRKVAPKGWLGGHTAEKYADAVDNNEVPACHLQDEGPDSHKTAMCAGALAVMANQAKAAHNTDGGEEARREVGKNPECFPSVYAFYEHHTGDTYVPGVIRAIGG